MTDKLVEQETRRWLYCCACGAPVKGSPDCNCQYFVISREEFLGYTKALASSSVPEQDSWQPIETAPKEGLIDIWFVRSDGSGERRVDCYYDTICGEWRTSRPGGLLVCIKERHVTHWKPQPAPPAVSGLQDSQQGSGSGADAARQPAGQASPEAPVSAGSSPSGDHQAQGRDL